LSTTAPSLEPANYQETGHLPAWKAELNAKLQAHRSRQQKPIADFAGRTPTSMAAGTSAASRAMAAQVAARVAARYAKEPSYSEVLAARAVAAAEAAHGAVLAAEHAHEAAQSLLTSVAEAPQIEELVQSGEPFFAEPFLTEEREGGEADLQAKPDPWTNDAAWWPTTVSHPEPLPIRAVEPEHWMEERAAEREPRFPDLRLHPALDVVAEATVAAAQPLLSKLIEFPRELIAARKPRPRLAEGPLLADSPVEDQQLRIFEVASVQQESHGDNMEPRHDAFRAIEEPPYAAAAAPDWHFIRLGEHPQAAAVDSGSAAAQVQAKVSAAPSAPLKTATVEDRLMASAVDFALIGMGFLLFVFCFAAAASHVPTGVSGLLAAGAAFAGVYLAYHWLFMNYRGGTPGMRYAEIALCTFDDDNPTRKALRARIWATLIAALPLGLGLVWAMFDEDSVGWHDRMTRTYQRSYK
jgi:uncharacterized RDD family membrane protein YckC